MSSHHTVLVTASLLAAVLIVPPSVLMAAVDESNLCLHDGRGNRATASMPDCEKPADLDGPLSGVQGVDGGYFIDVGGIKEFKASRRRVSDAADVQWAKPVDKRGILTGVAGNVGTYKSPTAFLGLRLNRMGGMPGPYQTLPIVAHGECRYLYNLSQNDIFVPMKTPTEWQSFLASADGGNIPGIFTNTCSIFCPGTCDNFIVFGPTSKTSLDWGRDAGSQNNWFRIELPYAPTGATWPTPAGAALGINKHTFRYSCTHIDVVDDYSDGYCRGYTTVKGACDKDGKCEPDTQYCSTPGTRCVSSVRDWDEVWEIPVGNVKAGIVHFDANGKFHSGWAPAKLEASMSVSKQVGGSTRPCQNSDFYEYSPGSGKVCGKKACVLLPGNPNNCGGGKPGGGLDSGPPAGLGCD